MNSTTTATAAAATAPPVMPAQSPDPQVQELKGRLKATWMTGDYGHFARYMESGAGQFFEHLAVPAGARLLDVGCGAGQLAIIAARAGLRVTGCDIATNWLEQARARAKSEGLDAIFEEGDAEALPYAGAYFDVVTSVFGAMFAPRPDMVAAELARVCRPGGMIAMANWTPEGFIGQMFKAIARHIAPPGMPSPVLWGVEDTVRERFGARVSELRMMRRLYPFEYPFPPEEVVKFFRANYGPMSRAFAALDARGQSELHSDLTRLWSDHNQAAARGAGMTKVDAEYLEVIGTRA